MSPTHLRFGAAAVKSRLTANPGHLLHRRRIRDPGGLARSRDWWPLTPLTPKIDADLILGPDRLPMATVLDPAPQPSPRRKIAFYRSMPAQIRWLPLLSGALAGVLLIAWFYLEVFSAVLSPQSI